MDIEEHLGPPRGLLLGIGLLGLIMGGVLAGEFIFQLQPGLPKAVAAAGTVIMPLGVGSDESLTFSPATVVVIIGQNNTVFFQNKDVAPHTVTSDDGAFDSGNIPVGGNWTYEFTTPGTFHYHCTYHSWMHGTVIVETSAGSTGTSSSTSSVSVSSSTTSSTATSLSTPGSGATVSIPPGTGSNNNLNYTPGTITVVIGVNNTVTFVNNDSSPHTVTADDGSFDSGNLPAGQSWAHTFTAAGTFNYHCSYHSWMKGTVIVLQS